MANRPDTLTATRSRRVLVISPHFPPDTSAATHRLRLLAPHLPAHGWDPTILTIEPSGYDSRLDPDLAELVPPSLEVVRCRAWPAGATRPLGFGDLGLRAMRGLWSSANRLLRRGRYDLLYITIYPAYPALFGTPLSRRHHLPFVLDYQDPWVGQWGLSTGPGGRPNLRSRLSRQVALFLEPLALRGVGGITAVSEGTYQSILERQPALAELPCRAVPLGGEAADFEHLRANPRPNRFWDDGDGLVHLCYVGTLLPLGFETLRALLEGMVKLAQRHPELADRLRLHFFGTSNQTDPRGAPVVLPIARELGLERQVSEYPPRIDYLDALTVLTRATGVLLMGSSERHYTASKLYPGLLSRRPLLALYHEASSVVEIVRRAARPPSARVVTYDDVQRAQSKSDEIMEALAALIRVPRYDPAQVDLGAVSEFSAFSLAGQLAGFFDRVLTGSRAAARNGRS